MPINSLQMLAPTLADSERNQSKDPWSAPLTRRQRHTQETCARLDREWLLNPRQFDPEAWAMERIRCERSVQVLSTLFEDFRDANFVDFGCGYAPLARICMERGAKYLGADASANALKEALKRTPSLETQREVLPQSKLPDRTYDLVLCTELIGDLPQRDHRLLVSEAARVLKPEGLLLLSTEITPASDALPKLQDLVTSEFEIEQALFSHHRLAKALQRFLEAPERFTEASRQQRERKREMRARRAGLPRWWFWLHSTSWMGSLWGVVAKLSAPLAKRMAASDSLWKKLERITEWLYGEDGISHVQLAARRKRISLW